MTSELIIYSKKNDLKQGMFGQVLIWFLEVLYDLQQRSLINDDTKLAFDINADAYDNIIPTFVQPKTMYDSRKFSNPKLLDMTEHKVHSTKVSFEFTESSFTDANKIWNRYFQFSDNILNKIPEFNGSNTLGIHYRGTDKNVQYNEANAITQTEFIAIAIDFLKQPQYSHIKCIYCCSDEYSFVTNLKAYLPHDVQVIEYIRVQTADNIPLHRLTADAHIQKRIKDELTISAFVDMLALSRCHSVLKTNSALSAFSKIINPELQLYTASAMKEKWFPTGVVRPYVTNTKEINHILNRTMMGHIFGC
jgi:hypothetical protein